MNFDKRSMMKTNISIYDECERLVKFSEDKLIARQTV